MTVSSKILSVNSDCCVGPRQDFKSGAITLVPHKIDLPYHDSMSERAMTSPAFLVYGLFAPNKNFRGHNPYSFCGGSFFAEVLMKIILL